MALAAYLRLPRKKRDGSRAVDRWISRRIPLRNEAINAIDYSAPIQSTLGDDPQWEVLVADEAAECEQVNPTTRRRGIQMNIDPQGNYLFKDNWGWKLTTYTHWVFSSSHGFSNSTRRWDSVTLMFSLRWTSNAERSRCCFSACWIIHATIGWIIFILLYYLNSFRI